MRNDPRRAVLILSLALVAGCGEEAGGEDASPGGRDAGMDAGDQDAGTGGMDAGATDAGRDAGAVDAGADAGADPCGLGARPWTDVATRTGEGAYAFSGEITGATDRDVSSCGFEDYPDTLFAYTPEVDGALFIGGTGLPTSYTHYVSVRTECERVATEVACEPFVSARDPDLAMRVEAGETVYFQVSGRFDSGPLDMSTRLVPFLGEGAPCDPADLGVTCEPGLSCVEASAGARSCEARCGDGVVDPGEDCDDGARVDGDGCSADCAHEDQGPGSAPCASTIEELVLVDVGGGRYRARASGDTTGAPAPETIHCGVATGPAAEPAPAAVYRVQMIPETSVSAQIIPEPGFYPVLLLLDEPCSGSGYCYDPGGAGEIVRNTGAWDYGPTAGEAYVVVTGGGTGAELTGEYLLAIDVEPR